LPDQTAQPQATRLSRAGEQTLPQKKQQLSPIVPKDFVTAPFFTARKSPGPRALTINDVKWTIGIEHPDKRRGSPALDMRHGRACFALLSFRDRLQGRDIHFSLNEFCHRYAQSQGGRYSREILTILFDLNDTWVRRELLNNDCDPDEKEKEFTIIGDILLARKPVRRRDALRRLQQRELWLDRVSLTPEFFALFDDWEKLTRIRLDVVTSISSPTAQAIYTFIPSRAVYHSKSDPFKIGLATLLQQIALPVPPHKSVRKKMFTQHRTSIMAQLDGKEIMDGVLRVSLAETKDGTDYNLLAWVEKGVNAKPASPPASKSKLLDTWRNSGRSKQEFDRRLKETQPLSDYHKELLQKSRAEVAGSERFFELAAALLGEGRFAQILSEAKGDALEGSPGHNPTGRLIYRLMDAIGKPVAS
jgi:hypothetical protein